MTDEALQNILEATERLSEELKKVNALIVEVHRQINKAYETQDKSQVIVRCTLIGKEPMQLSDLEAATDFKKLCRDLGVAPYLYYEYTAHAYICKLDGIIVPSSWLTEHQCEDQLFYNLGGFQFYLGSQVDYIKVD